MQTYTPKELNTKLKSLPKEIREVVLSQDTTDLTDLIGTKNNLHADQKGIFGYELGLMLMGLHSPQEFALALENEAGLSKETVQSIVKEVNSKIFIPLREKLEKSGDSIPAPKLAETPIIPVEPPKPAPQPSINVFADEMASEIEPPKENMPAPEPVIEEQSVVQEAPIQETSKVEEKKIEKKYAIDPYREPIE